MCVCVCVCECVCDWERERERESKSNNYLPPCHFILGGMSVCVCVCVCVCVFCVRVCSWKISLPRIILFLLLLLLLFTLLLFPSLHSAREKAVIWSWYVSHACNKLNKRNASWSELQQSFRNRISGNERIIL